MVLPRDAADAGEGIDVKVNDKTKQKPTNIVIHCSLFIFSQPPLKWVCDVYLELGSPFFTGSQAMGFARFSKINPDVAI